MRHALALAPVSLLAVLTVAPAGVPAPSSSPGGIRFEAASGGTPGGLSVDAQRAIAEGPLASDETALAHAKAAAADAESGSRTLLRDSRTVLRDSPRPSIGVSKEGLNDVTQTPSRTTSAVGTQRHVQTVNSQVGIYDRSLNLINQDTLNNWFAQPGANSFDPQVIWDPTNCRSGSAKPPRPTTPRPTGATTRSRTVPPSPTIRSSATRATSPSSA
jgi:hypothetical protein